MKIGLFLSVWLECVLPIIHIISFLLNAKFNLNHSLLSTFVSLRKPKKKKKLHIVLAKLKNTLSVFLAYFMYPIFH